VGVLVAVALIAACSDSNDDAADHTAGTKADSAGKKPTGEPITVVQFTDFEPSESNNQGVAGMKAAVAAINAEGGIGGRPLELRNCSSNADANRSAECARDAVADNTVIAEVGSPTVQGTVIDPILERASMARIGAYIFSPADFTSPVVFATTAGLFAVNGQAAIAADLDAKDIALTAVDIPATRSLPGLIDSGTLKAKGLSIGDQAYLPLSQGGDISAQIASLGEPDVLLSATTADQVAQVINTVRQLGFHYPIISAASTLTSVNIPQVEDTSNLFQVGLVNVSAPGYKAYAKDMRAAGSEGTDEDNESSVVGWIAIRAFQHAAEAVLAAGQEITRKNVLAQMRLISDFDTKGLTPPLDWKTRGTGLGGAVPNLINDTVVAYKFKDGKLVVADSGRFVHSLSRKS
jgi:branched-chain amino acid transport system substrate-binding protein